MVVQKVSQATQKHQDFVENPEIEAKLTAEINETVFIGCK